MAFRVQREGVRSGYGIVRVEQVCSKGAPTVMLGTTIRDARHATPLVCNIRINGCKLLKLATVRGTRITMCMICIADGWLQVISWLWT